VTGNIKSRGKVVQTKVEQIVKGFSSINPLLSENNARRNKKKDWFSTF
jgi:hypothetical protein